MQFILTQEEYDALQARPTVKDGEEMMGALEEARLALLKGSGYRCIHREGKTSGYCDGCPVAAIAYPIYHRICGLPKNWSK
jgi:hypothetical protein